MRNVIYFLGFLILTAQSCKKDTSSLSDKFVGTYDAVDTSAEISFFTTFIDTIKYKFEIRSAGGDKIQIIDLLKCSDNCLGIIDSSKVFSAFEIRALYYCNKTLNGRFLLSNDTLLYDMNWGNTGPTHIHRWGYAIKIPPA